MRVHIWDLCLLYSTYLQLIVVTSLFLPKRETSYFVIDTQILLNYDFAYAHFI